MNILSILIVEDEQPNSNRLQRMIQSARPDHEVLAVLGTVRESVDWLLSNPAPALIFMDIRLADGICFDIFPRAKVTSPIIFTTAYDEYLMQAFKVKSIDYLLKPVDSEELAQALDKFDQLYPRPVAQPPILYEDILSFYKKQAKSYRQRFLLPYRDGYVTLLVQDIEYFFSESKITYAALKNGEQTMVPYTLEELEEELSPEYFFRANRQYIIHVNGIQSIHNFFNSKLKVWVCRQAPVEVIISKDKAPIFKQWLNR
ncbi:LytTR family DNA-binding domain-containing protein [Ravibacter arvi]|uniref:LytTR family DNA-binding domain-containing protein n=1 Tax=Ravibacter arvi TaxID=2051041 RepID=A0ABP8LY28_9BACT